MSAIKFVQKGDFKKTFKFMNKLTKGQWIKYMLEKYGQRGVQALASATPVDTGKTASSWSYEIIDDGHGSYTIAWNNSNIVNDWANIAILLQYGHGTRNGGYVVGRDYINPAVQPIFEAMAKEAWEEVIKA